MNVICELADKNPKNYLAMAPQFFRLLTTSSNNWMLIKVRGLGGEQEKEERRGKGKNEKGWRGGIEEGRGVE